MLESLLTISLVGLGVGIVFSMPIAGPISILITSHGLRGQLRYCFTAALGAAIIDFIICFLALHGFTRLLGMLADVVPYVIFAGAAVLFIIGLRIVRARFDFEHIDLRQTGLRRVLKNQEKSGFWTGMILNVSNPALFFGWLSSSFIVLSFVSSLGLNVGGLDRMLGNNVVAAKSFATLHPEAKDMLQGLKDAKGAQNKTAPAPGNVPPPMPEKTSGAFSLIHSLFYAFFVAVGTIVWFFSFSYFLVRHRARLRTDILTKVIHALGIFLCAFALFLMGHALGIFGPR